MNNLEEAMKDMVKLLVHLKAKLKVEGIDPVCQNKITDFLEKYSPESLQSWMDGAYMEFDTSDAFELVNQMDKVKLSIPISTYSDSISVVDIWPKIRKSLVAQHNRAEFYKREATGMPRCVKELLDRIESNYCNCEFGEDGESICLDCLSRLATAVHRYYKAAARPMGGNDEPIR